MRNGCAPALIWRAVLWHTGNSAGQLTPPQHDLVTAQLSCLTLQRSLWRTGCVVPMSPQGQAVWCPCPPKDKLSGAHVPPRTSHVVPVSPLSRGKVPELLSGFNESDVWVWLCCPVTAAAWTNLEQSDTAHQLLPGLISALITWWCVIWISALDLGSKTNSSSSFMNHLDSKFDVGWDSFCVDVVVSWGCYHGVNLSKDFIGWR